MDTHWQDKQSFIIIMRSLLMSEHLAIHLEFPPPFSAIPRGLQRSELVAPVFGPRSPPGLVIFSASGKKIEFLLFCPEPPVSLGCS
ncbi:hypothetical protein PGB90_003587 [Kerria lacca]